MAMCICNKGLITINSITVSNLKLVMPKLKNSILTCKISQIYINCSV